MKRWTPCMLALFLWLPALAMAAGARAWLDRGEARIGETVTLNVEVEGRAASEPDFSALRTDFTLLGTQSSQQTNIVNGQVSSKTLWAVGLEPKREGRLTIPALRVGTAMTDPLVLDVQQQPVGSRGRPGDEVFIETSVEPRNPWVQQQVRYSIKLYFAVDLADGNMGEPTPGGIVARRLGQDARYTSTFGGRRYQVLERNYALTPEQSGALTIPAIQFRGSAIDAGNPGSFFNRGRVVTASGDAVTLDVRPKPTDWGSAPWLPAAELTLTEDSTFPDRVHVGDAVTRSVRLLAKGIAHEQIADPEFPPVDGADVYPDKSQTATRDDGSWLVGERQRKFAFVPNRGGMLTLPALRIRWFNTTTGKAETAVLPERRIDVLAGGSGSVAPSAVPIGSADSADNPASTSTAVIGTTAPSAAGWRNVAIAAVVLWLATLALWWWRGRRSAANEATTAAVAVTKRSTQARGAFQRSCELGDLVAAEHGLIAWARSERPQIHNVDALAAAVSDAAQRGVLADLQRSRYSGTVIEGLTQRLSAAFKPGFAWVGDAADATRGPLPLLYPSSRAG